LQARKNLDGTLTNGIFDDIKDLYRYRFVSGYLTHSVSKTWIEDPREEVVDRLSEDLRKHWGFYPDLPERLK